MKKHFDPKKDWRGLCFEAALRFQTDNDDWILVHALIYSFRHSKEILHAWCERGETVFDPTMGLEFDKAKYYAIQPRLVQKYNSFEMEELAIATGHYGPWEPELRKHLEDGI